MRIAYLAQAALVFCVAPALSARGMFKVGSAQRAFVPAEPYSWRGAKTHALLTTVWYPADGAAVEKAQWGGPPEAPLFALGSAAPGAQFAPGKFPLILLSHGTGGSAPMLAWLGTALAAHGYVAAAVNHPGNNALESYTPEGFSLWWERTKDLSEVIDHLLADPDFGSRIDPQRIGAAGFSLGGYTMIEMAGGITDRDAFQQFCKAHAADSTCKSPPEFPNLVNYVNQMDETAKRDPEIAASLRTSPGR